MQFSNISNPTGEILTYLRGYRNLHPKYYHETSLGERNFSTSSMKNQLLVQNNNINQSIKLNKKENFGISKSLKNSPKSSPLNSPINSYDESKNFHHSKRNDDSNLDISNNFIPHSPRLPIHRDKLDSFSPKKNEGNIEIKTLNFDQLKNLEEENEIIDEVMSSRKLSEEYENILFEKRFKLEKISKKLNIPPDNLLIISEWISSTACVNLLELAYELRVNTLFIRRLIRDLLATIEGFEGCVPTHTLTYICMICNYSSIKDWDTKSAMILMEIMKRSRNIETSLKLIPNTTISFINENSFMIDDIGFQTSNFNYKDIVFNDTKYFIHWRRVSDLVNRPILFSNENNEIHKQDISSNIASINNSDWKITNYSDIQCNCESSILLIIVLCILTTLKPKNFSLTYFTQKYKPYHHITVYLFDTKRDVKKQPIIIDDIVPCLPFHLPIGIYSESDNEVWPWILEKAVSKMFGSYEKLWNASIEDIFPLFTGFAVQQIDFNVWEILHYHYTLRKDFVVLGTKSGPQAIIIELIEHGKKLYLYEPLKKKHSWVNHDECKNKVTHCWFTSTQNIYLEFI